ncbi:hypothetical protein CK203_002457 [Vitis vinifera]|uniref:Uncharacterized protein n=1 Tax=Vitis vinifera TaxID=29760 RepID=A0A438KID1_VITVI|nr:hypothetical protein CK203_002457 [Vitis vinifera]
MMTLGGGRVIITLRAADRDRGGRTWAMAGCCDNVQDLLTSVNDPDKRIRIAYVGRPDALWKLSGCYVCECRVPLLEHTVPSVAFFLLRFFLRVFLLLPSAYLRFLSEALEFSTGDFRVVPVTAFAVFNPIFPVFTQYGFGCPPAFFVGWRFFSRVESRVLGWIYEAKKMSTNQEVTSSGPCGDAHAKKSVDKLSAKEFHERFCIPNGVSVELTDEEAVSTENNEDHIPPAYIHLNMVRVLMGCSILNMLFNLDLSLLEVLFIYSIKKLKTDIFSFVACLPSMQLVTNLPDSTKGGREGTCVGQGRQDKRGKLVEWVEKASFDRLNMLFEITAAERSCDTLLSMQNLRSVMQELQPYMLNILPRRMPEEVVAGEHFVLQDLPFYATAPGGKRPASSPPAGAPAKKKKKVSKKGKEVKLPTPPKEFVISPITYENEVTIKEPEHPVPPSISSSLGHLAGLNHSGPSMSAVGRLALLAEEATSINQPRLSPSGCGRN